MGKWEVQEVDEGGKDKHFQRHKIPNQDVECPHVLPGHLEEELRGWCSALAHANAIGEWRGILRAEFHRLG